MRKTLDSLDPALRAERLSLDNVPVIDSPTSADHRRRAERSPQSPAAD